MLGFVIPTYTFLLSWLTPKYSYLGQGLGSTKNMQLHLILCHIFQTLGKYLKQPSNVPISSGEQTPKSQHWQTYTMLANARQEISYLTCSKDQGHPLLKYKHVSCGGHSSCLPLLCSMYLSCVSIFGQTQTRVPYPPSWPTVDLAKN